jgi:hypothetical protein
VALQYLSQTWMLPPAVGHSVREIFIFKQPYFQINSALLMVALPACYHVRTISLRDNTSTVPMCLCVFWPLLPYRVCHSFYLQI